jgi:hypothetical protein
MGVDHSHIVPAGYLRQFAEDDERIRIVLTKTGREIRARTTVSNAGVRGAGQYKRERPDGSRSDDFETYTLQRIEDSASPILRDLSGRWPLSPEDKLALATFIGIQVVRGPRWFAWHDDFTVKNVQAYRDAGAFEEGAREHGVSETQVYEANLEFLRSSTQTLMKMAHLGAKLGCAIGSMCWTLVDFGRPVLATGDHPVVVWPMEDGGRDIAATNPAEVGIRNFLEVRLPVSPRLALLMTWRDRPDDPHRIDGKRHHADNLNAFTVAEAEEQWFSLPSARRPRIRGGTWLPLSAELVHGYSSASAGTTRLYSETMRDLQSRSGDGSLKVEIRYVEAKPQTAITA